VESLRMRISGETGENRTSMVRLAEQRTGVSRTHPISPPLPTSLTLVFVISLSLSLSLSLVSLSSLLLILLSLSLSLSLSLISHYPTHSLYPPLSGRDPSFRYPSVHRAASSRAGPDPSRPGPEEAMSPPTAVRGLETGWLMASSAAAAAAATADQRGGGGGVAAQDSDSGDWASSR
jgi:hypothetical protein